MTAHSIPPHWESIQLSSASFFVLDGDTFDIDMNRDGQIQKQKERVRLLYVDTPELNRSHKGKDVTFGVPAKQFLLKALKKGTVTLWVNPKEPYDKHHRLLAIVEVQKQNINLGLIEHGHSYFDTRFGFPEHPNPYIQAEVLAYENKLGIWSKKHSRSKYLKRMRREGKTVKSAQNHQYAPEELALSQTQLEKHVGKYVHVSGSIQSLKQRGASIEITLNTSLKLKFLIHADLYPDLYFLGRLQEGDVLEAEGFLKKTSKAWVLEAHHAKLNW